MIWVLLGILAFQLVFFVLQVKMLAEGVEAIIEQIKRGEDDALDLQRESWREARGFLLKEVLFPLLRELREKKSSDDTAREFLSAEEAERLAAIRRLRGCLEEEEGEVFWEAEEEARTDEGEEIAPVKTVGHYWGEG
jgi:hypothetical protein